MRRKVKKIGKRTWTPKEEELLKVMYERGDSCKDIAAAVGHNEKGVYEKAVYLGCTKRWVKQNNTDTEPVYKDKDWCYDRYIKQHMSFNEMAEEANCTLSVIRRWCGSIYGYNRHTYRHFAKMTAIERQIVMAGRLGDGHITSGHNASYIESHAENQKDYIFWKYKQLKTICTVQPKYYPPTIKKLNGKNYLCQGSYRMCSTVLDELAEIRDMSKTDIIDSLTELGVALYFLDDGCRRKSNWSLSTGVLTDEEVDELTRILNDKFGISFKPYRKSHSSYVSATSSKIIDNFILKYLPNDLDIVKYKVLKYRDEQQLKAVS